MLLLGALVGWLGVVGPSPALAHDGLVGTSPTAGSDVSGTPGVVSLEFTGEPLPLGTRVQVVGPGGEPVSSGAAEIRGRTVVQRLVEGLPAGDYRVDWRSASSDGHALSGGFSFTLGAGDVGSAGGPSSAAQARPVATAGGVPPVWVAAAVVLVVGVGVVLVTRGRRRG